MNMRLGGLQGPSGKLENEKILLFAGNRTTVSRPPASIIVDIPITTSHFPIIIRIIIMFSIGTFKIRSKEENQSDSQVWKYYK